MNQNKPSAQEADDKLRDELADKWKYQYFNPMKVPSIELPSVTAIDEHFKQGFISARQNPSPRELKLVEALEFYANRKDWKEFISTGNIFDEIDGDPCMAFRNGEDRPWAIANEALKEWRSEVGEK